MAMLEAVGSMFLCPGHGVESASLLLCVCCAVAAVLAEVVTASGHLQARL